MAKIGFLGLGAMGSRMAANLIAKGHEVTVYNRTAAACVSLKEKGATVASSPREAVQNVEFIISMVTDDTAARSIWLDEKNGALAEVQKGAVIIESSTVTPDWVKTLSEHVAKLNLPVAPTVRSTMPLAVFIYWPLPFVSGLPAFSLS